MFKPKQIMPRDFMGHLKALFAHAITDKRLHVQNKDDEQENKMETNRIVVEVKILRHWQFSF
jgi:hypothetical protein